MKKFILAALSLAALQSVSTPVWSQNKDQIAGAIFGFILNEAMRNGGAGNSGQTAPGGTAPRAVEGPQQPSMDVAERMAVQRALAAAGLYNGAIDGAIGPASRSAIAAWQSSVGADGSGYLTRDQADSLIAMAPPSLDPAAPGTPMLPAVATADPATIDQALTGPDLLIDAENSAITREMRARLYREFLLRYLSAVPERADDAAFIGTVLFNSARNNAFADPRVAEWSEQASRGTEFERQKAHEAFTLFLFDQASNAPLSLVTVKRIHFPEYDFNKGRFPLDLAKIFNLGDPTYFGPGAGITILATPGRWAEVSSLTVPEAEAEILASKVHAANGFVDVVMRMTFSNFRQNADGFAVSDLSVETVSLHDTANLSANIIGPTLLVVPDPAQATSGATVSDLGPARDAVESWSRLGAVVAGERLVIPALNYQAQQLLEPALDYLALLNSPDSTLSMSEIAYYGTSFLTEEEQRTLFGGNLDDGQYGYSISNDEFALAEIRGRFETTFGPALRARAPKLPVAARLVLPVRLGNYDFDRQVFPVRLAQSSNPYDDEAEQVRPFVLDLTAQPDFRKLRMDVALGKAEIAMPVDEAKALNARLKSEVGAMPDLEQTIFLAFDLTLDSVQAKTSSTDYGLMAGRGQRQSDTTLSFQSSVSQAMFYEDAALTRPIREMPLKRLEPRPGEVAGSAMPDGEFPTQTSLVAYALGKGANPSILTENANRSAGGSGADEFTRPEIADELVAMAKETPAPGEAVLFPAKVSLGQYGSGGFPITDIQVFRHDTASPSGYSLPGDTAQIRVTNIDAMKHLPMERDAARALAAAYPSRSFEAALELRLETVSEEITGDSDGRRRYVIDATAIALHLADPDDKTRRLAVVEPQAATQEAPAPAPAPAPVEDTAAAAPEAPPATPEPAAAAPAPQAPEITFDIVGLTLGMTLEDAAAAIKQHMTVARVLEWRSETVPPNSVGEMVRLYINDAGNEFIIVNYGPVALTPTVMAISRNLFLPVGVVSDGDLAKQLIGKYGDPEPGAGWQFSESPRLYGCADGGAQYTLSWVGAPLIEGTAMATSPIDPTRAATDPAYAAEVLVLARSSNLIYSLGASTGAEAGCKETVRAEIMRNWATHVTNPPLDGAVSDLLVTRLMDQNAMRRKMEEAMKAEQAKAPKVEIKL